MTPALAHLNALLDEESRRKHPLYPYPFRNHVKCNSANTLTQCVIKYIRLMGGQAERINTMGRRLDQTKTYTDVLGHKRQIGSVKWCPGTGVRGSADISATVHGRSVKIEVKWGADRQSAAQKEYEQSITEAGGIYLIVRTFDEFYEWYNSQSW